MTSREPLHPHLVAVAERLVKTVPELQPLYQQHLAQNFNDPLAYIFVADVARFIGARSDDPARHELIKSIFQFFENELETEPKNSRDIYDLIGAGFCEALEHEHAALPILLDLMPTGLRSMMNEFDSI